MLLTVTSSHPLNNFSTERGKRLFEWAEQTWLGFLQQILQVMEGDDISDHEFTLMCDLLSRVHSARQPDKHAESLKDWATLVDFPIAEIKAWEIGNNLPTFDNREATIRQMLERLVKYVRALDAEGFFTTMSNLVSLRDYRNPNASCLVSPKTYGRSVRRLGLPEEVSTVLFNNNIKTLGDLHAFLEPPRSGSLRFDSRTHVNPSLNFSPKEKLQKFDGVDESIAEEILETAKKWHNTWATSGLLV